MVPTALHFGIKKFSNMQKNLFEKYLIIFIVVENFPKNFNVTFIAKIEKKN